MNTLVELRILAAVALFAVGLAVAGCDQPIARDYETNYDRLSRTDNVYDPARGLAGAEPSRVEIGLDEFAINMPRNLPPGNYQFNITNNGSMEHNFEIEGPGLDEKLMGRLQPGESQTFLVTLRQGDYSIVCPLEGHDEEGMQVQLKVRPSAS